MFKYENPSRSVYLQYKVIGQFHMQVFDFIINSQTMWCISVVWVKLTPLVLLRENNWLGKVIYS